MKVAEAVVETLATENIDTVFGIPGTQSLPLNRSIDSREDIRFVMTRHETAAPHGAWGYAETAGEMAATVVIPGPGDMNCMNGLKNALNDCTPMIHISVETSPDVRGGDGIHETPPDTYDTVVKENSTATSPQSVPAELRKAVAIARAPPKGPVRVGVPKNFLQMDVRPVESGEYDAMSVVGAPENATREASEILSEATRPVVIAGGGVRTADAADELRSVAERLDAPVVPTYKGKGVFSERHELYAGILSVGSSENLHSLVRNSDVALGVGTDFDAVTTQQWSVDVPERLIHITLDETDIGTSYRPAVGIAADAKESLGLLEEKLRAREIQSETGAERARRVRRGDTELMSDVLGVSSPPLTSASVEAALDDVLPDDAIVSVDAGGFRIWSLHVLEVTRPDGFVDTGSWATMGTGLPAAMGAQLAHPDRSVVALVGDGGLMMCVHELHTLAVEDIPVTVVVLNNSDYATISAEAAESFGFPDGAYQWTDTPVSHESIAEEFGLDAYRSETPAEIRETVRTALDSDQPTLVEVPTDPEEPQAKPLD